MNLFRLLPVALSFLLLTALSGLVFRAAALRRFYRTPCMLRSQNSSIVE